MTLIEQWELELPKLTRLRVGDVSRAILKRGDVEIERLRKENERLRCAIDWALGVKGEFGPRPIDAPNFWWRSELRARAAKPEGPR